MDATGDGASSGGRMARRISMSTRNELVTALTGRYARSSKSERSVILDEFVAVSGYHRKHAIRLLGARQKRAAPERRARRRYGTRSADRSVGGFGPGLLETPQAARGRPASRA